MIGHQGPNPGRPPSAPDTSPTLPLDGQIGADSPVPDAGAAPTVPLEAAPPPRIQDDTSRPEESTAHVEPDPAGNQGPDDEHKGVDLARLAWLGTVGACLIAVAILLVQGYYGYAAVTCAVVASAALNLT